MRRKVWAFLTLALCGATVVRAVAGEPSAARIPITATVVSVDTKHATVTVRHEALETMPAGQKTCHLRHRADLKRLRPGTIIEAYADTRHSPWTLDGVRVRKTT